MKVKVIAEEGESYTDLEDKLEKAVLTKKQKRESAYDRESYSNDHFDQFHDMVMEAHQTMVEGIMEQVQDVLKQHLGVHNVGK